MRIINRVFNNNVVSAVDVQGEEVILVGSGLGYRASRGTAADESRVEREFHMTGLVRNGAFRVLLDIPTPVLRTVTRITSEIVAVHGYSFTPAAEVALADHLSQAVDRAQEGRQLPNPILWDTKASYPQEFSLAERAVETVEQELACSLPVDEVGFIALHFVNAGIFSDSRRALAQSTALHRALEIAQEDLGVVLAGDSPATRRFLVHLRFVIERITGGRGHSGPLDPVFAALREANPRADACALRISAFLQQEFAARLTDEEDFYLMLHLIRMSEALDPEPSTRAQPEAT